MAERQGRRTAEMAVLRAGIDIGMTLIDTAGMYADGGAETLVGEAIDGIRDQVFLVSKAYPRNAPRDRLRRACEVSLKRLATDRIDLYLLHWRGAVPLEETVEANILRDKHGIFLHKAPMLRSAIAAQRCNLGWACLSDENPAEQFSTQSSTRPQ